MPLDFTTLEPVQGSGLSKRKGSRVAGPNPFLDNEWLLRSYESGQDEEVTVDGKYETVIAERGLHEGEEVVRLTGDAADVVAMLRSASNKLGIGVRVEVVPDAETWFALPARRKGQITVKYLGVNRKQRRAVATEEETEETPE